jgi:hypothetical protein
MKYLVQSYLAKKWQSRNLNPELSIPKSHNLITYHTVSSLSPHIYKSRTLVNSPALKVSKQPLVGPPACMG